MRRPWQTLPFVGPALSTEANRKYLIALKTARTTGLPPTLYLGSWGRYGRTVPEWDDAARTWIEVPIPQDERTELDVRLETAYQFYTDALCQKCGTPWWYGHSTDNRIDFHLEQTTCYGCAKIEEEDHKRYKSKSSEPRFGVTDLVSPRGIYYEAIDRQDPLPSPYEAMQKAE